MKKLDIFSIPLLNFIENKKFNKILNLFYNFLGYIICKLVYKRKKGGICLEDKELIYKIQHGEKELLEVLIQNYYDDIYRLCYYKTGNASISYDLTQETFLKLIKYIGNYRDKGKFKSYLITIAMNVCNTYFYENNINIEELDSNQNYEKDNFDELEKIEEKDIVVQALNKLPEKQKEVIILKYYEDLKIKDISKILDEKVPTIKSRLKQGIEKLSRYLGKEEVYE